MTKTLAEEEYDLTVSLETAERNLEIGKKFGSGKEIRKWSKIIKLLNESQLKPKQGE